VRHIGVKITERKEGFVGTVPGGRYPDGSRDRDDEFSRSRSAILANGMSCLLSPFAEFTLERSEGLRVTSEGSGDWAIFPVLVVKPHHRAGVGRRRRSCAIHRAGVGRGIPGEAVPHPGAIHVAATPLP